MPTFLKEITDTQILTSLGQGNLLNRPIKLQTPLLIKPNLFAAIKRKRNLSLSPTR